MSSSRHRFSEYSLNNLWVPTDCSLSVLWVFSECCVLWVWSELVRIWVCSECSLGVFLVFSGCALRFLWVFFECSMSVLGVFFSVIWVSGSMVACIHLQTASLLIYVHYHIFQQLWPNYFFDCCISLLNMKRKDNQWKMTINPTAQGTLMVTIPCIVISDDDENMMLTALESRNRRWAPGGRCTMVAAPSPSAQRAALPPATSLLVTHGRGGLALGNGGYFVLGLVWTTIGAGPKNPSSSSTD